MIVTGPSISSTVATSLRGLDPSGPETIVPPSDSRLLMPSVRAESTTSTGFTVDFNLRHGLPGQQLVHLECHLLGAQTDSRRLGRVNVDYAISSLASLTSLLIFSIPGNLLSSSESWIATAEMSA